MLRRHNHSSQTRQPGHRANAQEILAKATLSGAAWICGLGAAGAIAALIWAQISTAMSIILGAGVVVVSNLMNWAFAFCIPRWLSSVQGVSFAGGFILKLVLLFIFLAAIREREWFSMAGFFGAFICAVVLSLIVSSIVVLREQGGDIGE